MNKWIDITDKLMHQNQNVDHKLDRINKRLS